MRRSPRKSQHSGSVKFLAARPNMYSGSLFWHTGERLIHCASRWIKIKITAGNVNTATELSLHQQVSRNMKKSVALVLKIVRMQRINARKIWTTYKFQSKT